MTDLLDGLQRRELPGGGTLVILPRAEPAVACVEAYVPAGMRRETPEQAGVALLTGRTLVEGCADWDGDEIARRVESVGGELVTTSVGGHVEVAAADLAVGVDTLLACLGTPTFPADRVDRARARQRAALLAARDDPAEVARQAFDAAVYGDHPFGRSVYGTPESLDRLDAAACAAFHARSVGRAGLVVAAAGAVDPDRLTDRVLAALDRWPAREPTPFPDFPAPPTPAAATHRIPLDADKAQAHVFLGHLGVPRDHPDYCALYLMDHVLGVGAGFTDRLSRGLRDRDGLAYELYASITSSATLEPGTFHAYIGTGPELVDRAVAGMRAEIARIRDEPIPDDELADARAYLVGSDVFHYQTVRQLCRYLVAREKYATVGDWHRELPARLDLGPADVQAAARRHLDPDALTLVVAAPA